MAFLAWFTRNWADTDEPGETRLRPLELPISLPAALTRVEAAVARLPRWHVEQVDAPAATVRATRRTRLWRFVDDVTLRLEAIPGGTRIHAHSQSRLGKADLGQNRRNLIELLTALRRENGGAQP
jgi:uncharacterized protein (DUF1499 family)